MAKKPSRRRGKILNGKSTLAFALGTLAQNVLVSGSLTGTVTERTLALSQETTWAIRDLTVGEGPIAVGLAHSDYSDAEIEEYIENTGGWSEGDLVAQEIARRKIRHVGTFSGELAEDVLNDGKPVKTPMKWILTAGQGTKIWAYNRSSGALTTGAFVNVIGHTWLKPQ